MDEVKRPGPPIELNVVAAPGVVDAINRLTTQISITELPGEILHAVKDLSTAIREHAQKVHENTIALSKNTTAVNEYIDVTEGQTEAIKDQTCVLETISDAMESIAESVGPKVPVKATRMSFNAEIEEKQMPLQLHPDQKFKSTITFNGIIDGEPTVIAQGPFVAITQDPKVESPAQDDPTKTQTKVTIHGFCTQPASIVGGQQYLLSFPTEAVVDDPATANNTEKIFNPFPDQVEWIPATQAKATSMSMNVEVEP